MLLNVFLKTGEVRRYIGLELPRMLRFPLEGTESESEAESTSTRLLAADTSESWSKFLLAS